MTNRLLTFLLALVLVFAWAVPAQAQQTNPPQTTDINVQWYDETGWLQSVPAVLLTGDSEPIYWVTLDKSLLGKYLGLEIIAPNGYDQFSLENGEEGLFFTWNRDAKAVTSEDALLITRYQGDPENGFLGEIQLYVSTQPVPAEYAGGEAVIPVYYVHVNGQRLDFAEKTLTTGTHTLRPESSRVGNYRLVSDGEVQVTVFADGASNVASVSFYYDDIQAEKTDAPTNPLANPPQNNQYKSGYGYVTGSTVNLREEPSTSSDTLAKLPHYTVCQIIGDTTRSGATWYQVVSRGVTGYVHGDYLKILSDAEYADFLGSYEYQAANGSAAPVTSKPTSKPTAAPTKKPAQKGQVTVYYYTTNDQLLDVEQRSLSQGSHTIFPESNAARDMKIVGRDSYTVTVYDDGYTDPSVLSFYYEEAGSETPAPDTPTTGYGRITATTLTIRKQPSTDASTVGKIKMGSIVPLLAYTTRDGDTWYQVTHEGVTGYVHGDYVRVLSQKEVEQYLQEQEEAKKTPAPQKNATITVYYYTTKDELLDVMQLTYGPGTHTIRPSSRAVGNRTLTGRSSYDVTVYQDGSANITAVSFYYEEKVTVITPTPSPEKVDLKSGYGYVTASTVNLRKGPSTKEDTVAKLPTYVLCQVLNATTANDGARWYQVVASSGETGYVHGDYLRLMSSADLASFLESNEYKLANGILPVEAEIKVEYRLEDGALLDSVVQFYQVGTHQIYPGSSKVQGLTLIGEGVRTVYVDEDGSATPKTVTFTYRAPKATVNIHYLDDKNRNVAPSQQITLSDGTHRVKAAPENLSSAWELAPGSASEIVITVERGVASRSDVYFYYQQISTPAVVTVHYFDTEGKVIANATTETLAPGTHRISPKGSIPAGYELVSEQTMTVEVYQNGTYSPQEVAFYYRKVSTQPKQATITVLYKDDAGRDVAPSQTRTYTDGTYTITPTPENLPEGYQTFPGTQTQVQVTVTNGVASRSQVVFYYQLVKAEPTVFNIPVFYYDTMGEKVASTQYIRVSEGTYTVPATPKDLPAGYELMMESSLIVQVFADGSTDPEEIAFYYRAPERSAIISIYVLDMEGSVISGPFTKELSGGRTHTVSIDPAWVPQGYDPASAQSVQVYVSRDGAAEPTTVRFRVEPLVVETPIPVGEPIFRYAKLTSGKVAFRNEPSTKRNSSIIRRYSKNDVVFVLKEQYNAEGEKWMWLNINGETGYMASEYIALMTQKESDAYQASQGATPVPTFTPVPTATPTATPTAVPTPETVTTDPIVQIITPPPVVTEPIIEVITPPPAPTATPYVGYALTTRSTALRTGVSASEMSVIQYLQANELVLVSSQLKDGTTGESWSIVTTLNGQAGFVQTAALRYITDREAQPYLDWWDAYNAIPSPTTLVTPSPEPIQVEGYGITVGDNVPFRQMASEYARIIDNLDMGEVVYISGQNWVNGVSWHSVTYNSTWGYIRSDLVRLMTIAEEDAYLERFNTAPPTMAITNNPYNPNGYSSYGYVDTSSVNFREGPGIYEDRIGELKRYAFCLVLGTERVEGETWYHVSYGGQSGYVHGDYFHQMSISELEDFLGSEEYMEGIRNNSSSGNEDDDVGYTGTGGLVSAEDQTVNQWKDPNSGVQVSYAPYVPPVGSPEPITQPTATLNPMPGYGNWGQPTDAATPTPSPTPTFNALPDVTYPTENGKGSGGSGIVWVVVIGLLAIVLVGVVTLMRYQQKKRRIALLQAKRRANAARAQQNAQRAYPRQPQPGQPRTSQYPNPSATVRRPASNGTVRPQPTSTYARTEGENPYAPNGTSAYTPPRPYAQPVNDPDDADDQP